MRARNLALIVAVFTAAAATAAFVVTQLPREGQLSALPPAPLAPSPAELSPPLLPPAASGDATVDVRVTAGPEPLPDAEVRLYAAPDAPGTPWRRAGEARTDRSGTARIPARPGAYLVAARAPGLAPGHAEVVRTADDAPARADLVLGPPATVEGRATRVGDGPVAGAQVRLVPRVSPWPASGPPSAPPEETVALRTDAAGVFRGAGLARGAWALALDAPGYHAVALDRVMVPGPEVKLAVEPLGAVEGLALLADGRPAAGATVHAAGGDHGAAATAGADGRYRLAVPPGSYTVLVVLGERAGASAAPVSVTAGATSRAAPIRLAAAAAAILGQVTRAGSPAGGAAIVLLAHGTREPIVTAVTGADGRFALGPLAPTAYDLAASAPDASPVTAEGLTPGAGERLRTQVALPGTGTVVGTVRDPAGHALVGVRVRATARAPAPSTRAPIEVRTDFEGRFRLAPLPVGEVDVAAREDAVASGASRSVAVLERRDVPVELVLPSPGVLAGRVSDRGRRPPPGTAVVVAPRRREGSVQTARAVTDASGNFALALPAGEYRVHAAGPDDADGELRATPSFVRVDPGRTTELALPAPPAAAAGVELLVLEPGGAPSPGATVTLARPDDGRIALAAAAGDDGRVVLDPSMGIAARPVTIHARNGGREGVVTLTLPRAGTVAVHLAPGGALAGVVRGARAGFTLEVSSQPVAGGWRTVEVHRFAGERFTLGDLPAAPLRLVARADDGRRGSVELRLDPGERRRVEIALR